MANPKHRKILSKGVTRWNKWREKNPEEDPDLSEINLSGKNLSGINFTWANLEGANFQGAILLGANFGNVCAQIEFTRQGKIEGNSE